MNIRKTKQEDSKACIAIAKELLEWFDEKEISKISNHLLSLPTYVIDKHSIRALLFLKTNLQRLLS